MMIRVVFCFLVSATLLTTSFCSTSSAQWRGIRQPGQKVLRYLGQGYGPGYHWKTPGPNSNYYNPYSAHNSLLISQQGNCYQDNFSGSDRYQQPGIPYSVYAPTANGSSNFDIPGPSNTPTNGPAATNDSTENDFPTSDQKKKANAPSDSDGQSEEDANDNDSADNQSTGQWDSIKLNGNQFQPAVYSNQHPPTPLSDSESAWSLDDLSGNAGRE